MAVDQVRLESNQRLDLPDLQFLFNESFLEQNREVVDQVMTSPLRQQGWILDGFGISNPSAQQVQVTRGRAILGVRDSGVVKPGVITSSGNPNATIDAATLGDGTYGLFIRFEFVDGQTATRVFWNPSSDQEFTQTVNTRREANWSFRVALATPGSEFLRIGSLTVAGGIITALVDERPFYFEGTESANIVGGAATGTPFQSGWSSDGGGAALDRDNDRATNGIKDFQQAFAAMRQSIEDLKGRGLRNWWDRDIGGMNLGFDAQPVAGTLQFGTSAVDAGTLNNTTLDFGGGDFSTLSVDMGGSFNGGIEYNRSDSAIGHSMTFSCGDQNFLEFDFEFGDPIIEMMADDVRMNGANIQNAGSIGGTSLSSSGAVSGQAVRTFRTGLANDVIEFRNAGIDVDRITLNADAVTRSLDFRLSGATAAFLTEGGLFEAADRVVARGNLQTDGIVVNSFNQEYQRVYSPMNAISQTGGAGVLITSSVEQESGVSNLVLTLPLEGIPVGATITTVDVYWRAPNGLTESTTWRVQRVQMSAGGATLPTANFQQAATVGATYTVTTVAVNTLVGNSDRWALYNTSGFLASGSRFGGCIVKYTTTQISNGNFA